MSLTVDDGAIVPWDPRDSRVVVVDWDTDLLPAAAAIASQSVQVIGHRPPGLSITSITRSSTTATVTTAAAHGLSTGAKVTIAGAEQADYNISATITVVDTTTFTYTVANSPTTPATGTLSYAQGLEYDNLSAISSNRKSQLRLTALGDGYRGREYEVATKIVTNESPTQTFERSFYVEIKNEG